MNKIDYSIIVPVYNEYILNRAFNKLDKKVIKQNISLHEKMIFADDGSQNDSFDQLQKIYSSNKGLVKLIKFSRNFGQFYARTAGFNKAQGQCMIQFSADLQDPPELINDMLKHYFEDNYEIVTCKRTEREDRFFKKIFSKIFYWLFKKLCFDNTPVGGFDFVLVSKKVSHILLNMNERNTFFQGQLLWTGFDIKFIPYKRVKRESGKSGWTFNKKTKLLVDSILSYSYFPLRLMSYIGIIVALIGFIYAGIIIFNRLFSEAVVKGWASNIVIILVLSGVQMMMIGVIGEYLWRTLDQVKNKPQYIIEKELE
jgi:dolichol-phosphate mannosyltransferase